jgi:OmpA-OmpF porin, OOP family
MKKITSVALLGACAVVSLSTVVHADQYRAPYGAIMGDYELPDSGRDARNGIGGIGLVGVYLTPHIGLESNFWGDQLRYKDNGGTQQQLGGGIDVTLGTSDGRVALFGLLGAGAEDDVVAFGQGAGHKVASPFLDFGAGMSVRLDRNIAWRTEVRYYDVFYGVFNSNVPNNSNIGDVHINTGLQIALGTVIPSTEEAPPPPPPPPPPPYVPVTPPPPPPCPPSHGFKMDANCHIITQTIVLHTVNFEFNKATLTPYAKSALDEIAAGLVGQSGIDVEVSGHTDSVGRPAYNKRLSQKRAEAVKEYLIAKGVTVPLTAVGFGEERPIATNKTDAGRAENRRVEFKVTGDTSGQTEGGKAVIKVPEKKR